MESVLDLETRTLIPHTVMQYEKFEELISSLQRESNTIGELYERKVDLIEFADPYHGVISLLLKEIYGEEGHDWFSWFCYENDFGKGSLEAWDENGKPFCQDVKSLWEYLEEKKK